MPGADRTLDLGAVQQAPLAPPLGVLCPDEAFDRHSPIKLRRAWDGIRCGECLKAKLYPS